MEITPDKVEPELRGQPWRLNSPFAQSVGLSTHVIVIPHNASGTNDGDIQKVGCVIDQCELCLFIENGSAVVDWMREQAIGVSE